MSSGKTFFGSLSLVAVALIGVRAPSQQRVSSPAQTIRAHFASINSRLLTMAKDFPAEKYNFRLKPEMRSFGEVLVHATSGTVYATKAGRGEKANWDELNPKDYPTKAAVVALMEKSIADANTTLKGLSEDSFAKTIEPWASVEEHSSEHYGLLVAYYRANGLVPPESRPKK